MLYIIALVILLIAVIMIYIYRVIASFVAAHRAHRALRRDPESAAATADQAEAAKRPSIRAIAREVTQAMFPPREQDPYVPNHRRSSAELYRSNYGVAATAVYRAETRDGELPTYLESASMPKPPPEIYAASTAHPTATRQEADQASIPSSSSSSPSSRPGHDAPPQYHEQPIVRQL